MYGTGRVTSITVGTDYRFSFRTKLQVQDPNDDKKKLNIFLKDCKAPSNGAEVIDESKDIIVLDTKFLSLLERAFEQDAEIVLHLDAGTNEPILDAVTIKA